VNARLGLRHGGPLDGEQLDDARLSGTRLVEQLDVQTDKLLLGALLATVPLGGALLATVLFMALSLLPSSMATIFLMARSLAHVNGASL
jgi:hypothetical protein